MNPKPFKAERWYFENDGDKNCQSESFATMEEARNWMARHERFSDLDATITIDGFKVEKVWIDWTGYVATDARVKIEGVGEVTIVANLPAALKHQVEQFFMEEAYNRIRARAVATNPQTYADKGEPL